MTTDADLPALPDGDLRGALLTGDPITAYTAAQMYNYARAAIAAERQRAGSVDARVVEDAERYRWLRDVSVPPHNFYLSVPVEFAGVKYTPQEVDAAIDAARSKP